MRADLAQVLVVGRALGDGVDDLELERLVLEERQTLLDRVLVTGEGLVLGDDRAHLGVDAREVVVTEVCVAGQLEVVVEAVRDRRTDRVLRPGPEARDGLGQDVGARVTKDVATGVARRRHDRDDRAVG